jgi:diaminopimelate decarboxylase
MDHFNFKQGELFCEDVPIKNIAEKFGTPAYVYSKATLLRHLNVYQKSLECLNGIVCFSVKALSNLSILKLLDEHGSGFDIVSGGELHRCIKAGIDPKKIIFSGVGKSADEIALALKVGILSFNVESESELKRIYQISKNMNLKAPIGLRVNPDVDAGGHEYIKTGKKENKFGISFEKALDIAKEYSNKPELNFLAITCHIGSQILDLKSFKNAAEQMLDLANRLDQIGLEIKIIDMGGGLGVKYIDEETSAPAELMEIYKDVFSGTNKRIFLEPGRSIAANAGILLAKVEYLKNNFLITDTAMNDLLRPALYKANHQVVPLLEQNIGHNKVDVVGPVCESGDYLAKEAEVEIKEDEFLAIRTAGAYGFVMSSNYNSRPRACEILVEGDDFRLIRQRESHDDLFKHEIDLLK